MRAMPAMVVAGTLCPWRAFDRKAPNETGDEVAGADGDDCAGTGAGDCGGKDDGAADAAELLAADEIGATEVTGAAGDDVVVGGSVLAVTRGVAWDAAGERVGVGGAGLVATATAHSVFGYPSMPHTSPASAPVPMRTAVAAARTSAPVSPSCTYTHPSTTPAGGFS